MKTLMVILAAVVSFSSYAECTDSKPAERSFLGKLFCAVTGCKTESVSCSTTGTPPTPSAVAPSAPAHVEEPKENHRLSASVARVEPPPPQPPAQTPPSPIETKISWRGIDLELRPLSLEVNPTKCAVDAIKNSDDKFPVRISRCMTDFHKSKGTSSELDSQLSDALAQVVLRNPKTIRESMIVAKGMLDQILKPYAPNTYNYDATSIYDIFRMHRMQCTSGTDFLLLNAAFNKGFNAPNEIAIVVLKPRHVIAGIAKPNANTQISIVESVVAGKGTSYIPVKDGKLPDDTRVLLAEDFWVSRLLDYSLLNKDDVKAQMLARAEKVLGIKQGDITPAPPGQKVSGATGGDDLNKSLFDFGSVEIPSGDQPRPAMDGIPPKMVGIGVLKQGGTFTAKHGINDLETLPLVPPPNAPQAVQSKFDDRSYIEHMKFSLVRALARATAKGKGRSSYDVELALHEVMAYVPPHMLEYLEHSVQEARDQLWDITTPVHQEGNAPDVAVKCWIGKDANGEVPPLALRELCPDIVNSAENRDSAISYSIQAPKFGYFHLEYEMNIGNRKRSVTFISWSAGVLTITIQDQDNSLSQSPTNAPAKRSQNPKKDDGPYL